MYYQNAQKHIEQSLEKKAVAAKQSFENHQAKEPSAQNPCDQAGNDILSGWLTVTLVENTFICVKYYIIHPFQSFCNVETS